MEGRSKSVAVVGRGLAGLTLARELVLCGFNVTVLGKALGSPDASWAAQGVSSVKGLLFGRTPLFQAKLKGHRYLREWITALEKDSGMFIEKHFGLWEPFEDEEHHRLLRQRIYKNNWTGAFGVRVESNAVYQKQRDVRVSQSAFYHSNDAWVDFEGLLKVLEAICRSRGVVFREERVSQVALDKGLGLVCGGQRLNFDEVFLCAGAETSKLANSAGVSVKVKFKPGITLWWDEWSGDTNDDAVEVFLFGKKSLILAGNKRRYGSLDCDLGGRALSFDIQGMTEFHGLLKRALTSCAVDEFQPEQLRYGVRVIGADTLPLVGFQQWKDGGRLGLFTAFHKSGLQLVPLAAKHLARHVLGDKMPEPWRSFNSFTTSEGRQGT